MKTRAMLRRFTVSSAHPEADRSPRLACFAEKAWISVDRAAAILDISVATLYRLRRLSDEHGRRLIDTIDYGRGKRQRVKYASVVRFCDRLRERYAIADRRPRLDHPMFRWKDVELLPFPPEDTISVREALAAMSYESETPVLRLCEEGAFDCYQILPHPGSRWRISRNSFSAWLEKTRNRAV